MRYNHPIDINNLNDSSSVLYSFVKEGSSVLDVGCACGTLAQILYKKKQCHVSGIEYNTENFAICRKLHIFENLWQIDLNQLKKEQLNNFNQYFDAIILGDVLEHLINPEQVLSLLKDLVKDNGRVLISLPNIGHASIKSNLLLGRFDYTEQGILDKTHLRFFTAHSIIAFLTKQNLRINHLKRITMPLDGYQYYKFSKLPKNIQDFIKKDKESYVSQYVMDCSVQQKSLGLLRHNRKIFKETASNIKLVSSWQHPIKREIMLHFPKLVNFLEKFR